MSAIRRLAGMMLAVGIACTGLGAEAVFAHDDVSSPSGYTSQAPDSASGQGATTGDEAGSDAAEGNAESTQIELSSAGFIDVPDSHPFHADIAWLAEQGIASGWPDGSFRPNQEVSRDAVAAFLYRYAGSPDYVPPAVSPFKDIQTNHPFYKEISWAAASGIAAGYADGTYRPLTPVTRGALATFLWRLAGNPAPGAVNPFTDAGVWNAQRSAIMWMGAAGLSQGFADHTYRPEAALTRGDAAAFLHRYDTKGLGVKASPDSPAKDPAAPQGKDFADVAAGNAFRGDIAWLSATGITTGYADGRFDPAGFVTRDAMAAFLYRFAGSPSYTPPAASPFKDVAVSSPFYKEIAWVAASGVAAGYEDGTFRPGSRVTRAAMAAFLYRLAGNPGAPRAATMQDTGCSEHRTAISWLAGVGITTGYADGSYRPEAAVERQALAAFLHRMCLKGWAAVATPWAKVAATTDPIPDTCRNVKVDCTKVKCVAFTFDDGPNPTNTPKVLDVLKRHKAHGTFFTVGNNVQRYPWLVRQEVAEGHQVGSHTWDHPDLRTLSVNEIRSQLSSTDAAISAALGYRPGSPVPAGMAASGSTLVTRYMRPPYGVTNKSVYATIAERGQMAVLWNVDTRDWENRDVAISTRNALAGIRPGAIVLWHDIHPVAGNALDGIMTTLEKQGYRFVTVEELTGGRHTPGGVIRSQ